MTNYGSGRHLVPGERGRVASLYCRPRADHDDNDDDNDTIGSDDDVFDDGGDD